MHSGTIYNDFLDRHMVKRATPKRERAATQTQRLLVAIVVSRYNETVTRALLAGALQQAQVLLAKTEIFDAAGAFEVLGTAAAVAATGRYDGILTLGCIVKGETKHDDYLAHAVTSGLGQLTVATGTPVSLGVLTVNSQAQALARAGGKHGNKGAEAMAALVSMIRTCRAIRTGMPGPSVGVRPDKLRR